MNVQRNHTISAPYITDLPGGLDEATRQMHAHKHGGLVHIDQTRALCVEELVLPLDTVV